MPEKVISSSIRTTKPIADQIDAIAARSGFQTRSKFMIHAALNYGQIDEDPLISELAGISFALHQLRRAGAGEVHLLKPRDIALITRRTSEAMTSVIERGTR